MRTTYIAVTIAFIAVCAAAQPQRTFVSAKLGNDANACTLAAPCRNLQRGVDVVAAGGEVIPLDSGGYGTLLIQKGVSIAAPAGVQVGVTTTSPAQQYAIIVATSGNVLLRGIAVTNLGGWGGIYGEGGGALRIESCTVDGGQYSGIVLYPKYGLVGGTLMVADTSVTRNGSDGISVSGTDSGHRVTASLERVRSNFNGFDGVAVWDDADVSVRNSVFSGNLAGVQVVTQTSDGARLNVEGCMILNNQIGVLSDPPAASPGTTIVRVSNSVIAYSSLHGIWYRGGHIYSRGNNTVYGNAADEVFVESFAAK